MPLPFILGGIAAVTAATGAKKAYDGFQDKSSANTILRESKKNYEILQTKLEKTDYRAAKHLDELGELYLKIGQDFHNFQEIADELLGTLNKNSNAHIKIDIPKHEIRKIEALSMNAVGYAGKIIGGGAAGAASAYAVYGGTMALAAASTGTPIAALSGVAAYNATLAAIGGGSLAAGGLGMAGGTMILGGVVAAPVLAVAGWAFASHAKEALEKAKEIQEEVNEYSKKAKISIHYLDMLQRYIKTIIINVEDLYRHFENYLDELKEMARLVRQKQSDLIAEQSEDILLKVENGYAIAAILTNVITTPIFKIKTRDGNDVYDADGLPVFEQEAGGNALNDEAMQEMMDSAADDIRLYS